MLIVNKRHWAATPRDVYIGRPSVLGNPFSHLPGTLAKYHVKDRDEAVERYGRWLLAKIRDQDADVMEALENLSHDSVLVCWCAPQRCHGEMISRAYAWLVAD